MFNNYFDKNNWLFSIVDHFGITNKFMRIEIIPPFALVNFRMYSEKLKKKAQDNFYAVLPDV